MHEPVEIYSISAMHLNFLIFGLLPLVLSMCYCFPIPFSFLLNNRVIKIYVPEEIKPNTKKCFKLQNEAGGVGRLKC